MLSTYRIKLLLSGVLYAMLVSAIPSTVAHSVALLADDTGRAVLKDGRNGEQSAENRADNPDFTVCNHPLCVSRRIDTWQIVYRSYTDPCPTISSHKMYIHVL